MTDLGTVAATWNLVILAGRVIHSHLDWSKQAQFTLRLGHGCAIHGLAQVRMTV
jgi:hypothetical protein